MKFRRYTVVVASAFVIALLVSLFVFVNFFSLPLEVATVRIGIPPNEQSMLLFVAEEKQFFAANGLNASVKVYPTALAALDGLLAGEVDLAQTAEFPLVRKIAEGERLSFVATIDRFLNMFLVSRRDAGIEVVPDLSGKTVGTAKGTLTEFHLGRFLSLNGVPFDTVNIVHVPFSESAAALANGTVVAFQAQNRDLPQIKAEVGEENLLFWPSQSGQSGFELISGNSDWVEANHEVLVRVLKSLVDAEAFVAESPEEGMSIIQGRLGYSDEYMATIGSQHSYTLSLSQALILAMEDEARWMIGNGLLSNNEVPVFEDHVYFEGLATVKPQSVSIIR